MSLVSQWAAGESSAQIDDAFSYSIDPFWVVEANEEGAADGSIEDGSSHFGGCSGGKIGIGVQEKENLGLRLRGSEVELGSPAAGAFDDPGASLAGDFSRAVLAATVADDQLVCLTYSGLEARSEVRGFVQDRYDDGESRSAHDEKATLPKGPSAIGGEVSEQERFSHLDERGRAQMVDVSEKEITRRVAEASCRVLMSPETVTALSSLPKGDAVTVARLAGIQAAKRTGELIPLAHPLPLHQVEVFVEKHEAEVEIRSRVVVTARTGAEMEALTACSVAALALYDMVKAREKGAVITDLRLDAKSGGRSGDFRR